MASVQLGTDQQSASELFSFCSALQEQYEAETTADARKERGQFFTPAAVARFMAGMFSDIKDEFVLLDPGAGIGALSVAVCERLTQLHSPRALHIHLFENDSESIGYLDRNMEHCRHVLADYGHSLSYDIHDEDFILSQCHVFEQQPRLFERVPELPKFDGVITNPPYFKINKASEHADVMAKVIHGQPNIYCLFLAMSAELLREHGQMVAITPRSFCNGLYFREFRRWFFDRVALSQVHLFESRTNTFREAKVLQESIITRWNRTRCQPETVKVTTSYGREFDDCSEQHFPSSMVIDDRCGEKFICIPETPEDASILDCAEGWTSRFQELGLRISTGPVVMFRAKEFLHETSGGSGNVPLLAAHNIKPFSIIWPVEKKKWPLAFSDCAASQKHLVATRNYVLLKRFSAKEEHRRLTAGCLFKTDMPHPRLALENHINYIYHNSRELTVDEVVGIAALLNSALLDRYFRTISGNTQVNATEIRVMKFPDLDTISAIGKRANNCRDFARARIEHIVLDELGIDGALETYLREAIR